MAFQASKILSMLYKRPTSFKLRSNAGYLAHGNGNILPTDHGTDGARFLSAQSTIDASAKSTVDASSIGPFEVDDKVLYSGMTSKELMINLLHLHLIAHDHLVDAGIKVLKSSLMMHPALRQPILGIAKRTVYSQFCAGASADEASGTLRRMQELGLKSILNYSQEDAMDSGACDHNLECFLRTIEQINQLPCESVTFFCVKITAVCPVPLLERVSELLRWQHKHPEFKLPWKEDTLPLLAGESPIYLVQKPPEPLSTMEEEDLLVAKKRLWILCAACAEAGLPLLVDAEYVTVQPAIDYLTYLALLEYNKSGQFLVYGTIQAYLKDSLPRLTLALDEALKRGVQFGVKLVRGAYIARESALAASIGADSPIHSNIQQTHNCYDKCAAVMMERAASGQGAILLATHNLDSGRKAAMKANDLGLMNRNPRLQFAQLKGMADRMSLALVHAGFQVSKYLPFGPVADVIPYLIRRAEENRGLLGNTRSDRLHIKQELKRRFLLAGNPTQE